MKRIGVVAPLLSYNITLGTVIINAIDCPRKCFCIEIITQAFFFFFTTFMPCLFDFSFLYFSSLANIGPITDIKMG